MDFKSIKLTKCWSDYKVNYWLYNEKSENVSYPEKVDEKSGFVHYSYVCFAGFFSNVRASADINRVIYKPRIKIDNKLAKKWIAFCVEHGLLPKYINPDWLDDKGIPFDCTMPSSQLYMYLCIVRYVDEEPDLIDACMYLVNKEGLNIYSAFAMCCKYLCYNGIHNFVQTKSKSGYNNPDFSQAIVNLEEVIGLRNFIRNPKKYNKNNKELIGVAIVDKSVEESGISLRLVANDYKNIELNAAILKNEDEELLEFIKTKR